LAKKREGKVETNTTAAGIRSSQITVLAKEEKVRARQSIGDHVGQRGEDWLVRRDMEYTGEERETQGHQNAYGGRKRGNQ